MPSRHGMPQVLYDAEYYADQKRRACGKNRMRYSYWPLMMALTHSDQCGDASSKPVPKNTSTSAADNCVEDRQPVFAPLALKTWKRALQHDLAPSLYLVNHSDWHLNCALTEIIIAFAVAPALV